VRKYGRCNRCSVCVDGKFVEMKSSTSEFAVLIKEKAKHHETPLDYFMNKISLQNIPINIKIF